MDHFQLPSFIATAFKSRVNPAGDVDDGISKPVNPLSYPKSAAPFSIELFKQPTTEYRGAPLWAWNTRLQKDQLLRQIDYLAEMGLGGFFMHSRVGLDTEYLGEEFMDLVQACVEYAESKGLHPCLYDEDRWPSGACGGKVVQMHPEHKQKHVLFTPWEFETGPKPPGYVYLLICAILAQHLFNV
jgi:hypothetical protein